MNGLLIFLFLVVVLCIGFAVSTIFVGASKGLTKPQWELVSWEKKDHWDYILTLKEGKTGTNFQVRGSSTIWNFYPSGNRVGTMGEVRLSEIFKKVQWEEKDK